MNIHVSTQICEAAKNGRKFDEKVREFNELDKVWIRTEGESQSLATSDKLAALLEEIDDTQIASWSCAISSPMGAVHIAAQLAGLLERIIDNGDDELHDAIAMTYRLRTFLEDTFGIDGQRDLSADYCSARVAPALERIS